MPKATTAAEVQVVRFFEEAPLEKAEILFNIIKEKMRTRMGVSTKPQKKKDRHLPPGPDAKSTETGDA